MKSGVAVGHMAGKLASVLYASLKTMRPYDETEHRKKLGLPVADDSNESAPIEIQGAVIEPFENLNMLSEIPNIL